MWAKQLAKIVLQMVAGSTTMAVKQIKGSYLTSLLVH